jgi:polysaccharide deacetylase family protein (PEP-CTERM system associated)
MEVVNILTVDLEDEPRVLGNTRTLLDLFDRLGVRSTFFVLGHVAEKAPALVLEIKSKGHEIALHGYRHCRVDRLTPEGFRQDLQKGLKIITQITNDMIRGYRAPYWSLNPKMPWVYRILVEHGFKYDSSLLPAGFSRGVPPYPVQLPSGIWELPATCVRWLGWWVPVTKGASIRLLNTSYIIRCIRRLNTRGHPAIVAIHPWEIDTDFPPFRPGGLHSILHYINRGRVLLQRLKVILRELPFSSAQVVLNLSTGDKYVSS